jgi:hypothetical protein
MRAVDICNEAELINRPVVEADLDSQEGKAIVSQLKQAGYRMLGKGADATVWTKDAGTVIKIIMPDLESADTAAKTFYKFYEFCQQNKGVAHLPNFVDINGKHYTTFEIGGKEFVQIAMEHLYKIKKHSFEEAMVWNLSEFASNRLSWNKALAALRAPASWEHWTAPPSVNAITRYVNTLDPQSLQEYEVLYKLMVILYHTGKINKLGWDLHTENVMQRNDGTLVIIDPWFALNEKKHS